VNRGRRWAYVLGMLLAGSCADEVGDTPVGAADAGPKDAGMDASDIFGNASGSGRRDGQVSYPADAEITADAFFADDPPPMMCGPDGMMESAEQPGGTPNCPDDKNREGCPCAEEGMEAACWPGKRVNRNHGICKDGMTKCIRTPEFGLRWAACDGYVLPKEGASAGPDACDCFSSGTWDLSNLAPCIFHGTSGKTYLYSSKLTPDGKIDCGANVPEPPPVPSGDWSASSLNVDCSGRFELCYTIKAGDVDNPRGSDCVITRHCEEIFYETPGMDQTLSPLPAWSSTETDCARRFDLSGGYGEMTVLGKSIECDVVDDGAGNPYVFHRTDYCPPSCQETPTAPGCRECQTGGSGMFMP
jgi:hypothetical protein